VKLTPLITQLLLTLNLKGSNFYLLIIVFGRKVTAPLLYATLTALGCAGCAGVAAMQNKPMMGNGKQV
jgi:hypothetical protein